MSNQISEEQFQSKLKGVKIFCIIVGVLYAIVIILSLAISQFFSAILLSLLLIPFILFYKLSKERNIAGPIIGIVLGCLYIVSFTWTKGFLSILIGIAVLYESVQMYKYLKNNSIVASATAEVTNSTDPVNETDTSTEPINNIDDTNVNDPINNMDSDNKTDEL